MIDERAVYIISVAARLVEMDASTLRKYERLGFLKPSRTGGNLRLYSADDIMRLRQIKYLVDDRGLNLGGVELALELTERLHRLQSNLGLKVYEASELRRLLFDEIDELLHLLGTESE